MQIIRINYNIKTKVIKVNKTGNVVLALMKMHGIFKYVNFVILIEE